MIVEGHWKIAV